MTLHISSNQTIGQLQSAFAELYPNLKPVFFTKPHGAYKGSPAKFMVTERDTLLSTLSSAILEKLELEIDPNMPVWQFEEQFEKQFKLHMQVFRRSGNTWLETSVSDSLTLEEQEKKAEETLNRNFEFIDPMDYRDRD